MTSLTSDSLFIVKSTGAAMDSKPVELNSELKDAAITLAVFFGFLALGAIIGAFSGVTLQSRHERLAVSCSGLALSLGSIYAVIRLSSAQDRSALRTYSGMAATILGSLAVVLAG